MRWPDVTHFDSAGLLRILEFVCPDRVPIEELLYLLAGGRFRRAAVVRLEFVAVEHRRIMAGGEHHTANCAVRLDGERDRGRRCRLRCQNDLEIVPGKHLSGALAKLVRE